VLTSRTASDIPSCMAEAHIRVFALTSFDNELGLVRERSESRSSRLAWRAPTWAVFVHKIASTLGVRAEGGCGYGEKAKDEDNRYETEH
jgi:hypothetical protein